MYRLSAYGLVPSPSDLTPGEDSTFGNTVSSLFAIFSADLESNPAVLSLVESKTELLSSADPDLFSSPPNGTWLLNGASASNLVTRDGKPELFSSSSYLTCLCFFLLGAKTK